MHLNRIGPSRRRPLRNHASQRSQGQRHPCHDVSLILRGRLSTYLFSDPGYPSWPTQSFLTKFKRHYLPTDLQTSKTVGHQKHTDIGSLTLLFSEQRGLQVKPTGMAEFGFVEPREGCAIINVGDSLVFASEQAFHSCVHQVVPFNGTEDRFSIAYFLRPESEARYKDSEGRWITAGQWHDEKYNVFQSSHDMQKTAAPSILLGGMREIEV